MRSGRVTFPFASNQRICIGRDLAIAKMRMTVAEILQTFEMNVASGLMVQLLARNSHEKRLSTADETISLHH